MTVSSGLIVINHHKEEEKVMDRHAHSNGTGENDHVVAYDADTGTMHIAQLSDVSTPFQSSPRGNADLQYKSNTLSNSSENDSCSVSQCIESLSQLRLECGVLKPKRPRVPPSVQATLSHLQLAADLVWRRRSIRQCHCRLAGGVPVYPLPSEKVRFSPQRRERMLVQSCDDHFTYSEVRESQPDPEMQQAAVFERTENNQARLVMHSFAPITVQAVVQLCHAPDDMLCREKMLRPSYRATAMYVVNVVVVITIIRSLGIELPHKILWPTLCTTSPKSRHTSRWARAIRWRHISATSRRTATPCDGAPQHSPRNERR